MKPINKFFLLLFSFVASLPIASCETSVEPIIEPSAPQAAQLVTKGSFLYRVTDETEPLEGPAIEAKNPFAETRIWLFRFFRQPPEEINFCGEGTILKVIDRNGNEIARAEGCEGLSIGIPPSENVFLIVDVPAEGVFYLSGQTRD